MDRAQIVDHVRITLATVLDRELPELSERTRLFEELALDSSSAIELLMSIEDTMDIEVDVDRIQPEAFVTVGSFVDFVQASLADLADRAADRLPAAGR